MVFLTFGLILFRNLHIETLTHAKATLNSLSTAFLLLIYLLEADMGESLNLRAENSLELAVDSPLEQ